MKPSNIIKNIYRKDRLENKYEHWDEAMINAILQYLDEEHEKNKACEHKRKPGAIGLTGYCEICGKTW